ncbi:hypothetical protein BDZ85DRAFT_37165 [Elsinoe ampelina]|uniref:Uncharacterized protein n=1 Tax=Elsinoe ampelina TaxID=302913 RepID=A0A6A6G2K3_9PEZI|nr:hypothetical protein BDZ85DRAFT_37165 [Elsinoe ampelina]
MRGTTVSEKGTLQLQRRSSHGFIWEKHGQRIHMYLTRGRKSSCTYSWDKTTQRSLSCAVYWLDIESPLGKLTTKYCAHHPPNWSKSYVSRGEDMGMRPRSSPGTIITRSASNRTGWTQSGHSLLRHCSSRMLPHSPGI